MYLHALNVTSRPAFTAGTARFSPPRARPRVIAPNQVSNASGAGYDLVRTGDERWRLDLPVPGLGASEIDIETRGQSLVIRTSPTPRAEDETVVHAGLAPHRGEFAFVLGEHVRVEDAALTDGILSLQLVRAVPEALQPRTIAVAKAA